MDTKSPKPVERKKRKRKRTGKKSSSSGCCVILPNFCLIYNFVGGKREENAGMPSSSPVIVRLFLFFLFPAFGEKCVSFPATTVRIWRRSDIVVSHYVVFKTFPTRHLPCFFFSYAHNDLLPLKKLKKVIFLFPPPSLPPFLTVGVPKREEASCEQDGGSLPLTSSPSD